MEENLLLDLAFACVDHHQDHVGGACGRDDLATTSFALRGTFDDSGEIQQLDLCAVVLERPTLKRVPKGHMHTP